MTAFQNRQHNTHDRVRALLGEAPVLTLLPSTQDADAHCLARVARGENGAFYALIRDDSVFLDRVRRGVETRFVAYQGGTPVVGGTCAVTPRGRLADGAIAPAQLLENSFCTRDCVVIEIALSSLHIDEGETPAHGAVPRT